MKFAFKKPLEDCFKMIVDFFTLGKVDKSTQPFHFIP